MEATLNKPYVRYQTFSPVLEPEDDLLLKFEMMDSKVRPTNDCTNAILVQCTEQGVTAEVISATLVWKNCGNVQLIEAEPEDIEIMDGKLMSVSIEVEDVYLAPSNDFEFYVDTAAGSTILSRGRIYL